MYINNYRRRFDGVFFFFLVFLIICIGRLAIVQLFRAGSLADQARKQHSLFVELEPRRGAIYDSNLRPQAVNTSADSLYACPNVISERDKETVVTQLCPILNLEPSFLKERLYRKKSFVWLARKISPQAAEAIKKLNLKGIGFMRESRRCYPNGYLASHILGFAGLDNVGLEGLELYCDKYLKGEPGWALMLRDARQKKIDISERMVSPKNGYDVVLTIDEVIQFIAESQLDKAFRTFHAKGASIVVMDPHTGAILALANRPTFDLNEYASAVKDIKRNRAICDLFEPGSVFKIVTASAALQENRASEKDKFFCENGSYKIASHILHDHRPHGWLTFSEVIMQSSNIGTSKVAQLLGKDILYKYVRLFGFGAKSGIDLPGEISGMTKEPRFWSKISIAMVPMGQEVGVTALQLADAISVIANGGQLMKPYIVKEIRDQYGEPIKQFSPAMIRKVISLEAARRVSKILQGVITEGTGKLAQVEGFTAAGKTGTAQKLEPNGTYSHNKFVGSFIGFAPAEDPQIVIAVVVDEPHPYYYGGVVAAPVFKNVAEDVLRYLKTKQPLSEVIALNASKTAN
ncbi:MAG: peptidoglycan D,D-transpeptidase FtsI family protein [Deltaproteobacteria bacterium]